MLQKEKSLILRLLIPIWRRLSFLLQAARSGLISMVRLFPSFPPISYEQRPESTSEANILTSNTGGSLWPRASMTPICTGTIPTKVFA